MKLLQKIFFPSFLIFSILLLIYTIYKSEFFWGGDRRGYYSIYYFISLLLITLSISTFFINKKLKEYIFIFSMSIFFAIYFCETYLISLDHNFLKKNSKNKSLIKQHYEKQTGKKWDERTLFEIYKDLKKENLNTFMDIGQHFFEVDSNLIFSLSGIENAQTVNCNENGYYSMYDSDRYGFNNPDSVWDSDEVEYILVGDSFAHGLCVNRPHDIASVLRRLSKKTVINLGWRGNGPLSEYATLREYLNPNVKKILWLYYEGNDLLDLSQEMQNKILTSYISNYTFSQDLKLKTKILKEKKFNIHKYFEQASDYTFFNFVKIDKLRSFIKKQIYIYKFNHNQRTQNIKIDNFKKIIKSARDLVNENNSEIYFVYLPEYRRFLEDYDNSSYNSVKFIINELDIPFIDMTTELFNKVQDPLKLFPFGFNEAYNIKGDRHYNVYGYKLVAENIYKFLNNL